MVAVMSIAAIINLYAGGQEPIRVLFVGNSFTFFYNLPQVVSAMAETQGIDIITRQSTIGGSNLEQHWKGERGAKTVDLIKNGNWDYVVFNNHSTSAIEAHDSFMEYGVKFAELVKQTGARPVFMMTWAYKSNPLMLDKIVAGYKDLSEEVGADYVPCGPLFAEVLKYRPSLEMYFDDKHPSSNGTYMLGLAFFKYLTGKSVMGIPKRITTKDRNDELLYLIFMNQADADFLQQLVERYDFKTAAEE